MAIPVVMLFCRKVDGSFAHRELQRAPEQEIGQHIADEVLISVGNDLWLAELLEALECKFETIA